MKKKLYNFLLLFIYINSHCIAQTAGWHYQAGINTIKEPGFYNIDITAAINAHLKTDYSDLRIVNDSGKWVPHVISRLDSQAASGKSTIDLTITKKTNTANTTELIVQNSLSTITDLILSLKNTDADRFCNVTGSDDGTNWFIINDSMLIHPIRSLDSNNTSFTIQFPPNNYQYYKLLIDNKGKAPFNILGIKTTLDTVTSVLPNTALSTENPATLIVQKDSGKLSFIKVDQTAAYHFDAIHFKISGTKYFSRTVDLYIPQSATHSFYNPGQLLRSFTVSNNSNNQFKLPVSNAVTFYLIIHNEDNLPVKTEEVKTFNARYVATVYLEKENKYKMILDNQQAATPSYDLQLPGIDKIRLLPEVAATGITAIEQPVVTTNKATNNKWMIWLMIAIAVMVLGFFTYKLITDMNKPAP